MTGGSERARLDDWMRQGYALHQRGSLHEAAGFYRRILEADPGYADATFLLGVIAEAEGRADEAAALFQAAATARPEEPAFLFALGKQQYRARRFEVAAHTLQRGLALQPDDVDARHDYGSTLMELSRWDDALSVVEPLAQEAAQSFAAQYNLANLYRQLGRVPDALRQYRKAIALDPSHLDSQGCLLFMLNYSDRHAATEIFAEHRAFGERLEREAPMPARESSNARRLRIGYLSPDFRHHAVASFIGPVLEHHDRKRFEVRCYYTHTMADDVTARLRGYAEQWTDCGGLPDEAIAARIRADRIDILVDLAGHTAGGRIGVLAMKPAPVLASYAGYPNTTGLRAVDYRIADAITDPAGSGDALNVEKVLRLPRAFLAYRPLAQGPEPGPLPLLRNGYVTFGCHNNFLKLSPSFFHAAAKLLLTVPRSRLVLKGGPLLSRSVAEGVRARFAAAGVTPDRLELLGWTATYDDHLGAYRALDIALDSFPYTGTTTTCEALWMGVPVVTLKGDRHAARVSASLLGAMGLDAWVASNVEEYVSIAAHLATDVEALKAHRAELRERMRASPLMDEQGLTRELEAAYVKMGPGAQSAEPLRLHVGGEQSKPGWKILNVQPAVGVDFVGDCTDLGRFADGSVQEIYASHVLEHLGYLEQLPRALAEFHRVLEPGGKLSVSVPDFEFLCRQFIEPALTVDERVHVMRMAFGGQVDAHDFHYVGLSEEILGGMLRHAGFASIERVAEFGLFDDTSATRFRGALVSLNVIARR